MIKDIRQLIDLKKVDTLLEGFNKSTGFVSAILDLEGNVLSKSGWRTICAEFHRINPETSKRCTFSDTVLANSIKKSEKYHAYQCLNGLMDMAVPLKIKGEHVANLFSGQLLFEEPDVEFFRKQAATFGFDEKQYLDALSKVPVVSEEKVKTVMDFLLKMTEFIRDLTVQKLEQEELTQDLRDNEQKLETSNQQLQAIEQQLRNVIENTGSVFYSHTTDHKINFISPQIEEILGYTPEEVMIKWTELASDNPINEIGFNHTVKAIETGKRQAVYELELVRKDGKKVFVEVNESPVVKNGKTVAISGSLADITERKHAEEELEKNEEKYRLLFANNPQPMWIYDFETLAFLEVNEAAVNHYGYSKEEFLSMTLKDIRPVEDIPAMLEEIKKAHSGLNTAGEWRHLKKNGEIIDVEITSHSLSFNDRKARHILINDITERKRAENGISKLSRAVEQSATSIIITDLNGKIEYINPKTLEITGYTKEELLGKNPRIFNSGEKPQEDYQQLWSALLSGREWTGEFHNKKKNGELYWESASISPIINEKQEIINYLAIKEDITEQKNFIQDLKIAKEKAEESDRLKSAFLANMSHEIRTPMNGILGFTELLREPHLSSEQKDAYIDIVNQSGKRMLNTVNDIIEISKIEAGIVTVDLKEVDVQERLDEILRFFNPEATKKGLKLTLENEAPKAVAIISTDQNKIDSILTNLIKNAIKFTQAGEISAGCKLHENRLEFYVKDTGIGIPTERQQAVFERFIKADILDKDARQGSGLGLAITKAYVEMLGGEIHVESEEGIGSTFFFTLPLNGQVQERTGIKGNKIQEEKTSQTKGLNIVIAEDEETSALYLKTILQTVSSKIILTTNGNETVETCRNNPDIDLVLMDIQMPEMNGYDATREIRKFNKYVIIIAQTAFALAGDYEKALGAGCNGYISKPINKKDLLALITKNFINK